MIIKELIEYGKNNLINKEEPIRLSKMLLKYLLQVDDTYIVINNDKDILEENVTKYKEYINLLNQGIPIQYITNNQEFMKLNFYVDKNVLIPQQDTEILVQEVISILSKKNDIKVLDLCTGSGVIGISLAKYIEKSHVVMTDVSINALEIAKKNAINNEVNDKCKFVLSNMFENILDKFDVIVSNPPYIKSEVIKSLSKEVQNEPKIALDGGDDGLEFYKIIAKNAANFLSQYGFLALEIRFDQKDKVIDILKKEKKYTNIYCKKDLSGNDRVIICNLK